MSLIQPIGPTTHWSYTLLVLHIWNQMLYDQLVLGPNCPTAHWFHILEQVCHTVYRSFDPLGPLWPIGRSDWSPCDTWLISCTTHWPHDPIVRRFVCHAPLFETEVRDCVIIYISWFHTDFPCLAYNAAGLCIPCSLSGSDLNENVTSVHVWYKGYEAI